MGVPHKMALAAAIVVLLAATTTADARRRRAKIVSEDRRPAAAEVAVARNATTTSEDAAARKGKVFSLFSIVQFENGPCTSNSGNSGSGNPRNGTCYTSTECNDKGGEAEGNCAAGFGVCCLFQIKADADDLTVSENCTYVQNTNFPSSVSTTAAVSYTVDKCNNDVCFLRLDFETFMIQGIAATDAAGEGICQDTFRVTTATNQLVPVICGMNTGQHMYIDIGRGDGDSAVLAFTFDGTNFARTWDIKVTQIECSNGGAPPTTCLQYFTGLSGRITTFNWDEGTSHLNNQDYNICIRAECGTCCVRYRGCEGEAMAMTLEPNTAGTDSVCTRDHLIVPGASATCDGASRATNSRFCGANLNFVGLAFDAGICDCTAPFTLGIHTDDFSDVDDGISNMDGTTDENTIQSRGLCLDYTQVPC